MPNYAQYEVQDAQALAKNLGEICLRTQVSTTVPTSPTGDNLAVLVTALLDSMPYFGDPEWQAAQRGTIANLLATNMLNNSIAAQPENGSPVDKHHYSYADRYPGYQSAFYWQVQPTTAATQAAASIMAAVPILNNVWWGSYGLTVLTDAIRQTLNFNLNTLKLQTDLTNNWNNLQKVLTLTHIAVFQYEYAPTVSAINAIAPSQRSEAALLLYDAIANGEFTANINQSLSLPGSDEATAATWFLYNLWVALDVLGYPNVDQAITNLNNAGLEVPMSEIGPTVWKNGGYASWFIPPSGSDVLSLAQNMITQPMREYETTIILGMIPTHSYTSTGYGFSNSLCYWGSLNWYNPPSTSGSCFGKGTLVLMADGKSKPIEEVKLGEELMTNKGPRKVALIESPRRDGRALYQINNLSVFATAAHPFVNAQEKQKHTYSAIDPWALIDGIPTNTAKGVAKLVEGSEITSYKDGQFSVAEVRKITELVADSSDELVYDLLLENWEKDYPCYLVGGPDVFLATIAETVDPLYDPAITVAVITALEMVTPLSRKHLNNPQKEVPNILKKLDFPAVEQMTRNGFKRLLTSKPTQRPSIPKPEFYLYNGEWDPHPSVLEYHLVRNYGRRIQSELATGWKSKPSASSFGDRLALGLFDLELIGDGLAPNQKTTIEVSLHVPGVNNMKQKIELTANERTAWKLRLFQTLDLGKFSDTSTQASVSGKIVHGEQTIGSFLAAVPQNHVFDKSDHFVFAPNGTIVGRICLDLRKVTTSQLALETEAKKHWSKAREISIAIGLGRQLGYQLSALIEAEASM